MTAEATTTEKTNRMYNLFSLHFERIGRHYSYLIYVEREFIIIFMYPDGGLLGSFIL